MAAVILAAGAGRRLGGVAKALLPTPAGDTFLAAIVACARAAGAGDIAVVAGEPFCDAVAREAERAGCDVVVNPRPERGMASSVACGFAHLLRATSASAALLWPVDCPLVRPDTVARLAASTRPIAVPVYRGRGGHPARFRREVWAELVACAEAEAGARSVVRADPGRVDRVAVDDPGVLADVDRPEDVPR